MISIRDEQPSDVVAIREVNRLTFSQDEDGRIDDALRRSVASCHLSRTTLIPVDESASYEELLERIVALGLRWVPERTG